MSSVNFSVTFIETDDVVSVRGLPRNPVESAKTRNIYFPKKTQEEKSYIEILAVSLIAPRYEMVTVTDEKVRAKIFLCTIKADN